VKRKVTDRRYGSVTYLVDRVFDFDFRYYEPYRGNEPQSGLYVFKTIDLDSRDYPHVIERVKAYQGKLQQQIIIHYRNAPKEPKTIVRIKLVNDQMEFDIFFAKLELERHPLGKDVTVNWKAKSIHPEDGVFYTDANSFKIIKRDINAPKNYSRGGAHPKQVA